MILLIATLIQLSQGAILGTVNAKSEPSTVSTVAKFSLFTQLLTEVPSNGWFEIILPPNTSVEQSSNLQCKMSEPEDHPVTCSSVGNIVKAVIQDPLIGFFQIDIYQFTNPPSTTPTQSFEFRSYTESGAVLDQKTQGIVLISDPGQLSLQSASPTNDVVGMPGSIQISLTLNHPVPAEGKVKVVFPKWNPNAPANLINSMLVESQLGCLAMTGFDDIGDCQLLDNDTIIFQNSINNDKVSGTVLKFQVDGTLNPISTAIKTGIIITTIDKDNGEIDSGETSIQVQTPGEIFDMEVRTDTTEVQEKAEYRLEFKTPVPLDQGCVMEITFPNDININGSDLTNVRGLSLFGASRTLQGTINSQTNVYTIVDGCNSYKTTDLAAIVYFSTVRNPQSVKETASFSITIKDSNQFAIATVNTGLTYQSTVGVVDSIELEADNSIVNTQTSMTIGFIPDHSLPQNSRLRITFPPELPLASKSVDDCQLRLLKNLNPDLSCTIAGNQLEIFDPFLNNYIPSSTDVIQFNIEDIQMPTSSQPTSSFVIETFVVIDNVLYGVDRENAQQVFTATPGGLTEVAVIVAYKVAYVSSAYIFEFKPQNSIPQNGKVQITLPEETLFEDPESSMDPNNCVKSIGFEDTMTCHITGRVLTIENGFENSPFPGGNTLKFQISGIRNPPSTQPSSSFIMQTTTPSGYAIDRKSTGITIAVNQTPQLQQVAVRTESPINGAVNYYDFDIKLSTPLKQGDQVHLKSPSRISPPQTPNCSSLNTSVLVQALGCYTSNKDTFVTLSLAGGLSQLATGTVISIRILGFTNPSSTEESDNIQTRVLNQAGYQINDYTQPVTVKTTIASLMQSARIEKDSIFAKQISSYQIQFTTTHEIPSGGSIIVKYPPQVKIDTTTFSCELTVATGTIDCDQNPSTRTIELTNAFANPLAGGSTAVMVVNGIINSELAAPTGNFQIETYTGDPLSSNFYKIDKYEDGLFLVNNCDYPCKFCSDSDTSVCLECFPDDPKDKLQDQTCVSQCDQGRILVNGICEHCNERCVQCASDNKDVCTACGKALYPYLSGDMCEESCPIGYYGDTVQNKCIQCDSPCGSCESSADKCTSCLPNQLFDKLDGNLCKEFCPNDITVDKNSICILCSSNCATCTQEPDICTSCKGNDKLDLIDRKCKAFCPGFFTIPVGDECVPCDANCETCTDQIGKCTSCAPGLVLTTENRCATQCTARNQIVQNSICRECAPNCTTCQDTTDYCLTCDDGYFLSNRSCVSTCPSGFGPNENFKCVLLGLQCPWGYKINDAGDGCVPEKINCDEGYTLNDERTECIPVPGDYALFPFLFTGIALMIIVIISEIKDRKTQFITSTIIMLGFLEFFAYIYQMIFALQVTAYGIFFGTLFAFIMLVLVNVFFTIIYIRQIRHDASFKYWAVRFTATSTTVPILGCLINYKFFKTFYCRFFGQDMFFAAFDKIEVYYRPLVFTTIVNCLLSKLAIIVVDCIIFYYIQWGYQLLIAGIETFILELVLLGLMMWEARRLKSTIMQEMGEPEYIQINPRMFDNSKLMSSAPYQTPGGGHQFFENLRSDGNYDEMTKRGGRERLQHNYGILMHMQKSGDSYENKQRRQQLLAIINRINNKTSERFDTYGQIEDRDLFSSYAWAFRSKPKLRRTKSYEDFREHDEDWAPDKEKLEEERCPTVPISPHGKTKVEMPAFVDKLAEMRENFKECFDNCYAEAKPPSKEDDRDGKGKKKSKSVTRKTQTLHKDVGIGGGPDDDSDLDVVVEDDAELDEGFTKGLIAGVLQNQSDSDYPAANRHRKNKKSGPQKRKRQVPDFEITDITGLFDIDDYGNFIIIRNDDTTLVDKLDRYVNKRGYLIDEEGNVINKEGEIIFQREELDENDEIPAPYSFEKRKQHLLQGGAEREALMQPEEYKHLNDSQETARHSRQASHAKQDQTLSTMIMQQTVTGEAGVKKSQEGGFDYYDDEELVEKELQKIKQIDDGETSVESMMGETPAKYNARNMRGDVDGLDLEQVLKPKVPIAREANRKSPSRRDIKLASAYGGIARGAPKVSQGQGRTSAQKMQRDPTKELFPALSIQDRAQDKLLKLAQSISGNIRDPHTGQIVANDARQNDTIQRFENLRQSNQQYFSPTEEMKVNQEIQNFMDSEQMLSPGQMFQDRMQNRDMQGRPRTKQNKTQLERIYGPGHSSNMNRGAGDYFYPTQSRQFEEEGPALNQSGMTAAKLPNKFAGRPFTPLENDGSSRRVKGIQNIYGQKLDPRKGSAKRAVASSQGTRGAKFRTLQNKLVDDPELLIDNDDTHQTRNEMAQINQQYDKIKQGWA